MMGRRGGDQVSLFYEFRLDERVPKDHLVRRIDGFVMAALADMHERLKPYYSEIGRPSVDPELMIRMLIVGYCYGLRSERRLTQEVELHLAYRWFCRLDLDDKAPHHSTFSENRLHRFRESDVFRHIFERVVMACMAAGWSRARALRSTPASSRPMPAATRQNARRDRMGRARTPDARSQGISGALPADRNQSRAQATEGDLAE